MTEEEELNTVAANVEQRAFRKMWEFEGIDDNELKADANKKLGRHQPTYGAVGARVREYKKYLAKMSGNRNSDKEPLAERPQEDEEGI